MPEWETLAERRIRDAMESGVFENLAGAGKPLTLEQDAFEDPDVRMAHRLLRNHGFTLPWIEELNDLRVATEELRCQIGSCVARHQKAPCSQPEARHRVLNELREKIDRMNRRIVAYNLKAPSAQFHIVPFDAAQELCKAK
jgi:DNA-binding transcriptional MerR regulator